jgi:hypothetical protein
MAHLPIRRLAVAVVAFGVLGAASPAFASQPADGSVGHAGLKTPPGQTDNDRNHGYGCDDNNGAGKGNPAFAVCTTDSGPQQ